MPVSLKQNALISMCGCRSLEEGVNPISDTGCRKIPSGGQVEEQNVCF